MVIDPVINYPMSIRFQWYQMCSPFNCMHPYYVLATLAHNFPYIGHSFWPTGFAIPCPTQFRYVGQFIYFLTLPLKYEYCIQEANYPTILPSYTTFIGRCTEFHFRYSHPNCITPWSATPPSFAPSCAHLLQLICIVVINILTWNWNF